VTSHPPNPSRGALHAALEPTPECLDVGRFGEELTPAEQAHVAGCPRCETEFALWREFEESAPSADEGAAVQWIVADLRRRQSPGVAQTGAAPGWFRGLARVPVLAAAASALLAIGIGYVAWDPEPRLGTPGSGEQVYRTTGVQVVGPVGDVASAPTELSWMTVEGAAGYNVRVLEIDNTVLWQASSSTPRVSVPSAVVRQFVPGKTVLWEVTAHDAAGTSLGSSGLQRFRVGIRLPSGD
jgi:hypothetical protein